MAGKQEGSGVPQDGWAWRPEATIVESDPKGRPIVRRQLWIAEQGVARLFQETPDRRLRMLPGAQPPPDGWLTARQPDAEHDPADGALLEEYRQLCEYHRHEDRVKWTVMSIALAGAAALVAKGFIMVAPDGRSTGDIVVAAGLVFLGLCAYWIGAWIFMDIHDDTMCRLARAWMLELKLGIEHHLRFIYARQTPHGIVWLFLLTNPLLRLSRRRP